MTEWKLYTDPVTGQERWKRLKPSSSNTQTGQVHRSPQPPTVRKAPSVKPSDSSDKMDNSTRIFFIIAVNLALAAYVIAMVLEYR